MRNLITLTAALLACQGYGMTIQFLFVIPETCGNSNGSVTTQVGGGVPPYTFSWSNGSTGEDLIGVPGGTYTLTITDDTGAQVSDQVVVPDHSYLPWTEGGSYLLDDGGMEYWGGACAGQCNGRMAFPWELFGGTAPFSINWNASGPIDPLWVTPEGAVVYDGFCLGDDVTYTYSDALGCTGAGSFTVIGVDSVPDIISVHGACGGGANGRVMIYCPQMLWVDPSLSIYRNGNLVASPNYPLWPAQTVIQVQGLIADDYELRMNWLGACSTVVPFTIPALMAACGTVSGTVFLDEDQDCQPDAGEVRIPYQLFHIQPVDEWALSSANGTFEFALPNGNYTLAHSAPGIVPLCPMPQPVPFAVNSNATVMLLADSSTAPLDLAIYAGGTVARPGFNTSHHATVRNLSAKPSGAVQVVHTFDPVLEYVSAIPTPSSVSGNTITWDMSALTAYAQFAISIQFTVPAATPLGTVLNSSITVTCALTDNDLTNNTAGFAQTVTGSYDPNDKLVRTSSGWSDALFHIDQDEWIDYTIRFQNTGTDTAFTVVITDTIAAFLDIASFQQGTSSHTFDVAFKPGRVVEWTFSEILLPDSNVNEPASHGLVNFRIGPASPLLPGTVISNIANIYFDFNPPVITEPSVLVATTGTGIEPALHSVLTVQPNPTDGLLVVRMTGDEPHPGILRVRSMDGRVVMELRMTGPEVRMDVQGVANGAYVLELLNDNGQRSVARFVKQ